MLGLGFLELIIVLFVIFTLILGYRELYPTLRRWMRTTNRMPIFRSLFRAILLLISVYWAFGLGCRELYRMFRKWWKKMRIKN